MLPLVPHPRSVTPDAAAPPFRLDAAVQISGVGAADLRDELATRTGLTLAAASHTAATGSIRLSLGLSGPPESYALTVGHDGIELIGADAAGLFYGTRTLLQLVAAEGDGWFVPTVRIDDDPRFAYRGVMLDVARHFFPVDVVKGYIDRAAALKCNHLHLHLTDDQGWRVHVDARPELTARASSTAVGGDPGGFYSKADYAEIVAYAASRHMTVVPEIDVPGHTHAVGLAYPDVAADPVITDAVREVAQAFGGGLPRRGEAYTGFAVGFSSLRDVPDTYDLLADVFRELAASTPGPYLHLGGDEAHGTSPDDYARFLRRAVDLVRATGKTPMLWHEAGVAPGLGDVVGQYWGFVEPQPGAAEAARALVDGGGRLVLSPADVAYLDMKPSADARLGLTWANGPTSLDDAYGWEPTGLIDGIHDDDILGVEAPLWTETVRTAADIDALAFPRLAAVAEIAWSPTGARDADAFRARVAGLVPLWRAAGIGEET